MTGAALGGWLGLTAGLGCWLVVRGIPWRRSPDLAARIGPHLGAPTAAGTRPDLRRVLATAGARAGGWLGSTAAVRERLAVLDPAADVAQHRAQQVVWGVLGAVAGALAGWSLLAAGGGSPVAVPALAATGAVAGALARDQVLARAVRRRRADLLTDLPAVAELLALSVGAGENVAAAVERVADGRGPLCAELRRALGEVRTSTPLLDALTAMSARLGVRPLGRFVDGIAVAVESGSPLAEVLRAQAGDARDAERRRLLETGGRREVQMMVPVVFGVLPVTVVFAVVPVLAQLQFGS